MIGIGIGVTGNIANSYIQYTLRKFMKLCFRHAKLLQFCTESYAITRGWIHVIRRGVKEPYNLIAHIIGADNWGRGTTDKDSHVCRATHCTGGGSD